MFGRWVRSSEPRFGRRMVVKIKNHIWGWITERKLTSHSVTRNRLEWMQSENRFAVFVALLGVTAFIIGYVAWQLFAGAPFDSHLWAVPIIFCNLTMMGMLAAKTRKRIDSCTYRITGHRVGMRAVL